MTGQSVPVPGNGRPGGPRLLGPGDCSQRAPHGNCGQTRTSTWSAHRHRAKGDNRQKGQKRAFAASTLLLCFFLIVHTAEGLGLGSAGWACRSSGLGGLRLRSQAAFRGHRAARAGFGRGCRRQGRLGGRGSWRPAFTVPSSFPLGLSPGPGHADGGDGPGGRRGQGKREGGWRVRAGNLT